MSTTDAIAHSAPEPTLVVDGLTVGFGTKGERRALNGVSLTVGRGEIVALVGESGCGKSLTGLSIMGLLPPEAHTIGGSIRVAGTQVVGTPEKRLRGYRGDKAAMVFQDALVALNPLQPVGRQIDESLRIHRRGMSRAQRRERVLEILRLLGVPDPESRLSHLPYELSGGLRQRMMIAMALVTDPPLIIADEPTTALDVTIQAQILETLSEATRALGTSVLFITHDMGVVAEIADRVAVMYGGRVVETGDVDSLFASPAHPYTRALLKSVPRPDLPAGGELYVTPGSVPAPGEAPSGCPFHPRCEFATDACLTMPSRTAFDGARTVACWHPSDPTARRAVAQPGEAVA
ncbi:MAG TPA: ABC transporter ATP-binding protein [Gryllotalpicola sp.]